MHISTKSLFTKKHTVQRTLDDEIRRGPVEGERGRVGSGDGQTERIAEVGRARVLGQREGRHREREA